MYPSVAPQAAGLEIAQGLHPYFRDFSHPTVTTANDYLDHGVSPKLGVFLQDMRRLTHTIGAAIETGQHWFDITSHTSLAMLEMNRMQQVLIHRLLSLEIQKPSSTMSLAEMQTEVCRLAAIVYVKCALPLSPPDDDDLCSLRTQMIECLQAMRQNHGTKARGRQPKVLLWAQFVGGIAWSNAQSEDDWLVRNIARGARYAHISNWAEMEAGLRQICWMDRLRTVKCKSLWKTVQSINSKYWLARIELMQQEWKD